MSEAEVCPRCSVHFSARKALVSSGVGLTQNVFPGKDVQLKVRCPHCLHIFSASTLRLFGFLSANGLRWVVVGILVLCVVLANYLPAH